MKINMFREKTEFDKTKTTLRIIWPSFQHLWKLMCSTKTTSFRYQYQRFNKENQACPTTTPVFPNEHQARSKGQPNFPEEYHAFAKGTLGLSPWIWSCIGPYVAVAKDLSSDVHRSWRILLAWLGQLQRWLAYHQGVDQMCLHNHSGSRKFSCQR